MNTNLDVVGSRLREAIERRQVTPAELADTFQVSRSTVSQWLQGRNLTLKTLARFSSEFDISINWLIYGMGDIRRVSSLDINEKEEALITIMRYIKNDITPTLTELLKSIKHYNGSLMSVDHHVAAEKIFQLSRVARAKVAFNGDLLETNAFHDELIGWTNTLPDQSINCFSIVAPEYHNRLKASIEKIKSEGVGAYSPFELIHQSTKERVRVISKASLCQHQGTLAIEVLLKPVIPDVVN